MNLAQGAGTPDSRATTALRAVDRAGLFRAYNAGRALIRQGANIDPERLNRALGVAQMRDPRPYHYSVDFCDCPDSKYRPGTADQRQEVLL